MIDVDFSEAWESLSVMGNGFFSRLPYFLAALIVFLIFLIAGRFFARFIHKFARSRKKHRNLVFVLSRLTLGTTILIGLLVSLVIAIPSFKPGQLVQVLGLSTVAIGFAFRDILQNFLAGIIILLTEPFRVGDQIRVEENYGTVEDIHTRATTLRTFDRRRVVIPNTELFTKAVIVTTAFDARRIEHTVGIGVGDDIAKAKKVILDAVQGVEGVLDNPAPDVKVDELAPSSVNLRIRWWISPTERSEEIDTRDRVLQKVKETLIENGVDLPFPTQTILFHDQTDEADGDRRKQREGWPAGKGDVPRPRLISRAILTTLRDRGQAASGQDHRREFATNGPEHRPAADGERN